MQLTNEVTATVVKARKKVETAEAKKIVDLWTDVHQPVVQDYLDNLSNEAAFLNFYTLLETCISFASHIHTSSNGLQKYIENLLQLAASGVTGLAEENAWLKAANFFTDYIVKKKSIRLYYLLLLEKIANTGSRERKLQLTTILTEGYRKNFPSNEAGPAAYQKIIFRMVTSSELFAVYYKIFTPVYSDQGYNTALIRQLIDNNHLSIAEKYCQGQITSNPRDEINTPYFELLKEIYQLTKDEENFAKVLSVLFPLNFNFEDFLYINSRIPSEEERKKFRTKMLARASNASGNRGVAADIFCFTLMDHEKNYKKMIGYISSRTPFSLILQYFEQMTLVDKQSFLDAMVRTTGNSWYGDRDEKEAHFPALAEKMIAFYSRDYLKFFIAQVTQDRYYYSLSKFMDYLKDYLKETGS